VSADCSAYILAGGQSRRFGSDKARAIVHGQSMIARVAELVRPIVPTISVVAATVDAYADLDLRTIADRIPGRGPLSGLHAALLDSPVDWLLLLPCDAVGLRPAWLRVLLQSRGAEIDAVAFKDAYWEPLIAAYRVTALQEVARRLDRGDLAMQGLLDSIRARPLPRPPDWAGVQANTPEELSAFARGAISSTPP
jgi:molybdopterin-guanine dinucleotide biosynthesis protein A